MSDTGYDLAGLAKYLHMTLEQVRKLADRGELPGRKIKGEWTFAAMEVHHWLERRIGAADDDSALVEVETVLSPPRNAEMAISVATMIPPGGIVIPFLAKTKESVIREIVRVAINTGLLWDEEKMADAIRKREELHTTALENGVALLHPRRPIPSILAEAFLVLGIVPRGIPFGGGFNNMTDIFFLIGSTEECGHLRLLARLSRLLQMPQFVELLRACHNSDAARDLIVQTESLID